MTIAHRRQEHEKTTVHPLYEIRHRAELLERELIETKIGDTEALLEHLLKMNMLIRGLISVALAELEQK